MKTYRGLYPRICSFENLYEAFRKARRPDVAAFEFDRELEPARMQAELERGVYRSGAHPDLVTLKACARSSS